MKIKELIALLSANHNPESEIEIQVLASDFAGCLADAKGKAAQADLSIDKLGEMRFEIDYDKTNSWEIDSEPALVCLNLGKMTGWAA